MRQIAAPWIPLPAYLDLLRSAEFGGRPERFVRSISQGDWDFGIEELKVRTLEREWVVDITLMKPAKRRPGDTRGRKQFTVDLPTFVMFGLFALAGGRLTVVAAGKGDEIYHYLGLKFPREAPIDVQRLIIDAPADRFALVSARDHRDLRRSALGRTMQSSESGRRFRVRQDITELALRVLRRECAIKLILSDEAFASLLNMVWEWIDEGAKL